MTMQEENLHAGGKWETMDFWSGLSTARFIESRIVVVGGIKYSSNYVY